MSHECQCSGAGHCPRFNKDMTRRMHQICSGVYPLGMVAVGETVRQAYLARWSAEAGVATPKPRTRRFSLECVLRGKPTGETRPCKTCGGTKSVPLYACPIFGVCSAEGPRVEGVAWCRTCERKETPPAAQSATSNQADVGTPLNSK